jgi:cytosine/adenosine deaminase-related metal-dependent hydrolase
MQTGVIAPVSAMLSAGVFVGMAVDGNGSNNSSNMISDMKTAYNVHALADLDTALTTQQVLEMATIGSAKVLGREDEIGSLEIGKCADLVLMNWSQIQYAGGMHDSVECIIMCGDSKMVDTVMVNGKVRVRKGKLVDIDEGAKAQWINQVGNKWFANAYSKQ